MYQRAPDGYWRESPSRIIRWAALSVVAKATDDLETKPRHEWEEKLAKAINGPVKKYRWQDLYVEKRWVKRDDSKQPPQTPQEIVDAWETIPTLISEGLWIDAARERATLMAVPFDREIIEEALQGTMHMLDSIPETLQARLREIIGQAYDEKRGQFGFARMIRSEFADVSTQRAKMIAVTEWNRAASAATYISYKQQGLDTKLWMTLGDDRVCSICEDNAVMGSIAIDQQFFSGDLYPPAHPGCRCSLAS